MKKDVQPPFTRLLSGYRQVISRITSIEQPTPYNVNLQSACSRVTNIGGIQMKENKS